MLKDVGYLWQKRIIFVLDRQRKVNIQCLQCFSQYSQRWKQLNLCGIYDLGIMFCRDLFVVSLYSQITQSLSYQCDWCIIAIKTIYLDVISGQIKEFTRYVPSNIKCNLRNSNNSHIDYKKMLLISQWTLFIWMSNDCAIKCFQMLSYK